MKTIPLIISKKQQIKNALKNNELLLLDINSIYKKAIKNNDKKLATWNLRVVNSQLIELKENIDYLINNL